MVRLKRLGTFNVNIIYNILKNSTIGHHIMILGDMSINNGKKNGGKKCHPHQSSPFI
jgi:hypothetical protein